MKGKLITFEGVEGCGKTTQIQLCSEWLQGLDIPIVTTCEPGGTELGVHIRRLLLNGTQSKPITNTTELLLYAADRAQHVEQEIVPNLEVGKLVLCDRFTDSTVAYQGYGRSLDMNLIDQLNSIATYGVEPDLTLWLDLDVKEGFARKSKNNHVADRIEKEKIDFHYRVQQGYNYLASIYPQRIIKVDASLNPEEVHQKIQEVISNSFKIK
ncbi:MAG: dTMP kinase [Cyanobacteria bacterium P01_A01_bin.45]